MLGYLRSKNVLEVSSESFVDWTKLKSPFVEDENEFFNEDQIDRLSIDEIKDLCIKTEGESSPITNGSFGRIFSISDKYVCKVSKNNCISISEIVVLASLQHCSLLKSKCSFMTDVSTYILLPRYDCNLDDFSTSDITMKTSITKQLISALQYIHANNFLHLDISTNNILIKISGLNIRVCICDFSFTRYTESGSIKSLTPKVTIDFRPYENLKGSTVYSKSTDIWSLGMCLYKLWHNKYLINFAYVPKNKKRSAIMELSARFEIEKLISENSWPLTDNEYIIPMLNIDSKQRINSDDLCNKIGIRPYSYIINNRSTKSNNVEWDYISEFYPKIDTYLISKVDNLFNNTVNSLKANNIKMSSNSRRKIFLLAVILFKSLTLDASDIINKFGDSYISYIFALICIFKGKIIN